MRLEVPHGGGLVRVHEPAVASDIGGENRGEPAVDQGLLGHVSSRVSLAYRPTNREDGAPTCPSGRCGGFGLWNVTSQALPWEAALDGTRAPGAGSAPHEAAS